jgi:uncharacterized protein YndB with AHSA1/START domain
MIEVERHIAAPPRAVFDVLSDGWLYASWVVGASRIRGVDAEWPHKGARIHHSVGCWPAVIDDTTHVVECEPERRLVLMARGWPVGEGRIELEVEPEEGGSHVVMREDAAKGPGRFVPYPLRWAAIAPRNVECLRRLSYLAEGRG